MINTYILSSDLTPPHTFAVFVFYDALSCVSGVQKVKKIESPWSAKAKNQTVQGELLSQYNIQVHFVAPSYKRSLVQQNCMRVLNTEGTLKAYYAN